MPMPPAYAIALADARSCLAALADASTHFDESCRYDRLLIDLDGIHAGDFPATYSSTENRWSCWRGSKPRSTA